MDSTTSSNSSDSFNRGSSRGRGRSRGGLGKYLRARGRGHRGGGRPAEFRERLVLEGEQDEELDEEDSAVLAQKHSRRQLGTNADRYKEPEPELDSDGEEIIEPEIDISKLLERQRLEDASESTFAQRQDEDGDIDHSLAHITSKLRPEASSRKGRVHMVEWDDSLEQMSREKATADAHRNLKDRFKVTVAQQNRSAARGSSLRPANDRGSYILTTLHHFLAEPERDLVAPPLPFEQRGSLKGDKEQMEEFLDELLD